MQPDDSSRPTLAARDAAVFLSQRGSSPVTRTAVGCDGPYLIDADGRRILDLHGNGAHHLGYRHPAVLDAVRRQIETLAVRAAALHQSRRGGAGRAARRALALRRLPRAAGPDRNRRHRDRAEARLRRDRPPRHPGFDGAWHGAGLGALSVGGRAHERAAMPRLEGRRHLPAFWADPAPRGPDRETAARRAIGSAGTRARRGSAGGPGGRAGALDARSAARLVLAGRGRALPPARHPADPRRDPDRPREDRPAVRVRDGRRGAGHHRPRQGARRRGGAARRGDRPRRARPGRRHRHRPHHPREEPAAVGRRPRRARRHPGRWPGRAVAGERRAAGPRPRRPGRRRRSRRLRGGRPRSRPCGSVRAWTRWLSRTRPIAAAST